MSKITDEQIHETYRLAKQVLEQELSLQQAKGIVSKNTGMDIGSAQGYINTCLKMLEGNGYSWTINAYGTKYFLEQIHIDFGLNSLLTSIASVKKHLEYYEGVGKSSQPKIKSVLEKIIIKIEGKSTFQDLKNNFEKQVGLSKKDKKEIRASRLKATNLMPRKTVAEITVYIRNPDVAVEVLLRANGVCERCKKPAPFIRAKNNTPYLEIHHKKQLAYDGEDSVENALALCPNCHRELHYGV